MSAAAVYVWAKAGVLVPTSSSASRASRAGISLHDILSFEDYEHGLEVFDAKTWWYPARTPGADGGSGDASRDARPARTERRLAEDGGLRHGLLLGRREDVLADARRRQHERRICRRRDAQPDLRRSVLRRYRTCRSGARVLRSVAHQLRRNPEGVLGRARPHAGHASGQRRRDAVPLDALLLR